MRSLRPRVAADERAILALWLPPAAAALFKRMPLRDQQHSLHVFYTLRSAGCDHRDLLAAALLHDVGKGVFDLAEDDRQSGRKLRLWRRVAIVLLEAIRPAWLKRLASDRPQSWRYPFHVHLHHPARGARLARQAGCSELTARLIQRHQERPDAEDALLVALQAADNLN